MKRKPLVLIGGKVEQIPDTDRVQGAPFSFYRVEDDLEIPVNQQMAVEFLDLSESGHLVIEGSLYILG